MSNKPAIESRINPETIVRIGAEGGSIALYGYKDSKGDWRYACDVNDQTLTFLTEEADAEAAIQHTSAWVNIWQEAMALLDVYPWARLVGLTVHPEFRDRVWVEVNQRLQEADPDYAERARQRWAKVCGMFPDRQATQSQ